MSTLRDNFHELGNYHNKISIASIVTRELLEENDIYKMEAKDLRKIVNKAIKNLQRIEEVVIEADELVTGIKPYIYEKVRPEQEICKE